MFWKKKIKDKLVSTERAELPTIDTGIFRLSCAGIDLRRAVLDWRDKHTENVELHLTREFKTLCSTLDEVIEKMTYRELFFQNSFGKERLEPILKEWVEREATSIMDSARKDLSAVLVHNLEYCEHGAALKHKEDNEHYADAAFAAAATGAGLAAIPAATVFSVASAGGIAGIFGITVISWPVVAIGTAVAGVLLMLGVHKATNVKPRALSRYRKAVHKTIEVQVLGSDGDNESLRQRLQSYISNTANMLVTEIDNGHTF